MPAPTKIVELLGVLARHEVDFIVVGGVAAVIQGAPVNTFDLDVVHARTPENIDRLLGALRELDAFYRMDLNRRLPPTASHLASPGHQLLATNMGTLDLLGTIEEGTSYEELLADTEELDLGARRANLWVVLAIMPGTPRERCARPRETVWHSAVAGKR